MLWDRGLGELTGVRPGPAQLHGLTEMFTSHPLNGDAAGDGRDALISPGDNVRSLAPLGADVQELAHLVRYNGADCGCCLSLYENELGGRVAVSSYAPWHRLGRGAKRRQLLSVADWLARGRLPLLIKETVRVAPFVRLGADGGRVAVVLLNMSLDPTGPMTLHLRAQPQELCQVTAQGRKLLALHRQADEVVVQVPSLPAWHTAVLLGS